MSATRRVLLSAAAAFALGSGCRQDAGAAAKGEDAGDMALGDPRAPVQLIEYASVTCSHCATFHETVFPRLKSAYIDTGKVRFIFREFPTPPAEVAVAGFQIARCGGAGPDKYFSVIDALFKQQATIFAARAQGNVKEPLLNIARSAGLSDDQFSACVRDEAGARRIRAVTEKAVETFKIDGTPALVLNGERLVAPDLYTYEGLSKRIDQALAGG